MPSGDNGGGESCIKASEFVTLGPCFSNKIGPSCGVAKVANGLKEIVDTVVNKAHMDYELSSKEKDFSQDNSCYVDISNPDGSKGTKKVGPNLRCFKQQARSIIGTTNSQAHIGGRKRKQAVTITEGRCKENGGDLKKGKKTDEELFQATDQLAVAGGQPHQQP